jgi:hypothetical protein
MTTKAKKMTMITSIAMITLLTIMITTSLIMRIITSLTTIIVTLPTMIKSLWMMIKTLPTMKMITSPTTTMIIDHNNIDDCNINGVTTTNVDTKSVESTTSKQQPHQDDAQIDKLEQSDDGDDDQDNNEQGINGQDNGLETYNNKGSRPAKWRRVGPSSDPDSDCNYKRRTQPTRECRLREAILYKVSLKTSSLHPATAACPNCALLVPAWHMRVRLHLAHVGNLLDGFFLKRPLATAGNLY